ncbi:DUF4143 domain-containing protein [Sphingomonas sp. URHD0057]|uniref:DUF4143 domain-containing protein n=1 Tax=Sphingomonas sp. URHD0057 TaxID=1380389 RepID=UPI0012DD147C|nr:DUF4143 domain-containing protein [Sphingomonas sp. URHD0057]
MAVDTEAEEAEPLRPFELVTHFERGGFVDSLYAATIRRSEEWRDGYIREQLPMLPQRPNGEVINPSDFWIALARFQGEPEEALRRNLRLDRVTFGLIVMTLLDHDLINRLEFWPETEADTRTPLIYIRDSGLWHRFYAAIRDPTGGGPNTRLEGKAWEAFNVEALRGAVASRARPYVWRRDNIGEIDLVLDWVSGVRWGIEISRSPSKRPSPGFHLGCNALDCQRRMVVCPSTHESGGGSTETLRLEDALFEIARGPT